MFSGSNDSLAFNIMLFWSFKSNMSPDRLLLTTTSISLEVIVSLNGYVAVWDTISLDVVTV